MTSLSLSNVNYSIGIKEILKDISFSIDEGDRLGIVGVNGSGKTTLLRIITGELSSDSGDIYIAKNKAIGIMKQNEVFDSEQDNTILEHMYGAFPEVISLEKRIEEIEIKLNDPLENIESLATEHNRLYSEFVSNGGLQYKSRCKSILNKLGFEDESFSRDISTLSGGQRTRLSLARLLFREPDVLILDEPTNHLDLETMQWLEGILSQYKKTLIIVSHDRYFLDVVTNKTLDIENTHATLYKVSYSEFVKQKEEKRKHDEKVYAIQQKEIARLEAFIEQQHRWNREKNIIAAESREKAIARMDKVEKPENSPQSIRFTFDESTESGNDVLSVKNLKMGFGNNILFDDLSFEIKKRERVFIVGKNGCGKSTLLKILLDQYKPLSGKADFGYNVRIGYYDQENQNLDYSKSVLDELWDSYPSMNQTVLRKILAAFMFRGEDVLKNVGVLSGGEKARLTIAKLILSKMNVLILDEPTNHLDIPSREALENALDAFDGTIITVSHDRYFIKKLASRVIDISNGAIDFKGGYEDYISYTENKDAVQTKETKISSGKEQYLKKKEEEAKRRKRENDKKKRRLEIELLEKEIDDLTNQLYGEAAYDYEKAAEIDSLKTQKEERLLVLYEEEERDEN